GWAGKVASAAVVGGGFTALIGRLVPPKSGRVMTPALGPSSTTAPSIAPTAAPTTTPSRAAPSDASTPAPTPPSEASTPAPPPTPAATPATSSPPVAGVRIGPAAAVPVGGAASFTDPRTGDPAYVAQPAPGRFVAFDASCTHQGCPVEFAGSEFQCPCH